MDICDKEFESWERLKQENDTILMFKNEYNDQHNMMVKIFSLQNVV